VSLNENTKGLLSEELLAIIKTGAILINTSRGAVVDEKALLNGLETGRILAAGLDVLTDEPEIEKSPLFQYAQTHDNLIITPHCGGFSHDAVRIVCRRAAEKIVEYLNL
jgi:phosphoglycerate dehydrogenase-like enzyme